MKWEYYYTGGSLGQILQSARDNGHKGWEMVNFTTAKYGEYVAFFKRQVNV